MHPRYKVRRLKLADLERILEIERDSFGLAAYDRNLFAEFFHKCGELFLVVERAGNIWGYIITRPRGGTARPAELVSLAVDPAERGKGAASALLASSTRRLRLRGIGRMGLMVKATNEPAQAFYSKHGFKKVRTVRRYYEDGVDGWLMSRVI